MSLIGVTGIATGIAKAIAAPRNYFGPDRPNKREALPKSLVTLDRWLKRQEAAYPDIRPNVAKTIFWHTQKRQRTPWAVVYIHGFSASRLETAPLAEQIADGLGANLFYTRLAGHGRSEAALGEASVQDWLADTVEAVRIGELIGERVLLIGMSTGATLATWLALRPEGQPVSAYVFLSPNFGAKDKRSEFINGPWGQELALKLLGPITTGKNNEPGEATAWTHRYPTRALFPVMALVKHVRESTLAAFRTPVMMLYSEQDETVEPAHTKAAFARIGAASKLLKPINYSTSLGQHVLAGTIKDAKATRPMAAAILKWVRGLPLSA